jgi:hypothetical protein
MMRIHVTDLLPLFDDSVIADPIPGIAAGTVERKPALAAWAQESRLAEMLHADDLSRRRHRRGRSRRASRLRG